MMYPDCVLQSYGCAAVTCLGVASVLLAAEAVNAAAELGERLRVLPAKVCTCHSHSIMKHNTP